MSQPARPDDHRTCQHQVGLDADVWLTPMPTIDCRARTRGHVRRDDVRPIGSTSIPMLDAAHLAVIRDAALEPRVQRIFVNPAIKRRCARGQGDPAGSPRCGRFWGHDYHFHIASLVPKRQQCQSQPREHQRGLRGFDFAYCSRIRAASEAAEGAAKQAGA